MNERLKQLAEQAGYSKDYLEIGLPSNMEKFAQLIVRECAGLFPNVYVEIETDYGNTPVIAADYIKKHFGVKE
jgi:hypothetical protein